MNPAQILSDRFEFNAVDLRRAAVEVASYRGVEIGSLRTLMSGYGLIGQPKWAAWRRKLKVEDSCVPDLNDQVEIVLSFIEPVFDNSAKDHYRWSPDERAWT